MAEDWFVIKNNNLRKKKPAKCKLGWFLKLTNLYQIN
jgi:hypothetical protein